jgi:hypothetical protein
MMAGATAIAALCNVFARRQQSAWRSILVYGIVCAIMDTIFIFHSAPNFHGSSPGEAPLFHFQAAVLPIQMGKLWFLIGVLCAAVGLSRSLAPEVRWSIVGLGVTNMGMLLGDAFVPGPPLFLTNHASYFEHATIAILLTFLAGALATLVSRSSQLRVVFVLAACFFCLNGALLAQSGYRRLLPTNREQANVVRWFERGRVAAGDLMITQHDVCAWIPFLTSAQVLFCRNAQAMLTPEQNRVIQRPREAWYLYFTGKDTHWVQNVVSEPNNMHWLETHGMYGEVSSYLGEMRTRQVEHVGSQLAPLLDGIENHDSAATAFLHQFQHVWIIDDKHSPIFVPARLGEYLDIHSEEPCGDLVVMAATPK